MQMENFPFKAVPQSHWPLASSAHKCVLCGKSFGLFQVAENCRGCGRVCCSSCLAERLVLPGQPGTAPVPVCSTCAKSISRTYEEAEMAMQRCQLLEEILNEQALQAEKLRSDLREQQEENKLLHHEKERLKATIARMEIEAEVAAAQAEAAATAAAAASPVTAASPTIATSPAASPAKSDTEGNAFDDGCAATEEGLAAMEERLNKKKRQLDLREATLKDALKKVSADAAKNADQRVTLQEREKQLTAFLTGKFTALFEEERQRMEDLCTEAVTDVQNQYVAWVGQEQDGAQERRRKYEQLMEERQRRVAAELAEVRASRDALQRQLESQKESMESLQAEKQSAAAAAAAQQAGEAASQELAQAAAAATQRAEAAEEEVRRMQSELDATKALYAEETQTRETAFAAYEAEQRQAQQRLEDFMCSFRAQQTEAEAEREAAVAAAVEAGEQRAAERYAQALAAQQSRLEAKATADVEAAVQQADRQHAAALESREKQHEAEIAELTTAAAAQQRQLDEMKATQPEKAGVTPACDGTGPTLTADKIQKEKESAAAAAVVRLNADHARKAEEWESLRVQLEAQVSEAERQLEKAVKDGAAAIASAAQQHAAALADLEAKHQREKDAWEKKMEEVRRVQAQQEEDLHSQDKSWKEEKAALQKACKELEAKLEARKSAAWQLQQQLRDCKQQLADTQAEHQKKAEMEESVSVAQSRAATALQRSAAAVVREVQQTEQRMLAEHNTAVTQLRSGLQEATRAAASASSQREKKARESVKQLQAQVISLKHEKEEAQQQLKAEQEKRSSAEVKHDELKAMLRALQNTEVQQRQAMTDLQATCHSLVDELQRSKAENAAQAAAASSAASLPDSSSCGLDSGVHLVEMQQRWVQHQTHTEALYVMALITVLQREWSAAMDTAAARLVGEAERQRQMRARNAKALENTTSTIREVQEDLRARAQGLLERQAVVEEQEHRLAEKKKRIDGVSRDLYAVAKQLRKAHLNSADCVDVEEVVRSARVIGEDG